MKPRLKNITSFFEGTITLINPANTEKNSTDAAHLRIIKRSTRTKKNPAAQSKMPVQIAVIVNLYNAIFNIRIPKVGLVGLTPRSAAIYAVFALWYG